MGSLHTEEGLPYAVPDHSRAQRQGAGEVIYGASKSAEQIAGITRALREGGQELVMATRVDALVCQLDRQQGLSLEGLFRAHAGGHHQGLATLAQRAHDARDLLGTL